MSQIQIPKGWASIKLSEILDIMTGFAFKSANFSKTDGLPLIRIRDLGKNTTQIKYNGEYDEKFLIETGDLLVGMDGEFKIYEWMGGKALLNQRICKLFNFSDTINAKFILYALQKYLDDIHENTTYTTVKHISHKQILEIHLPIPSLETQKKIVQKLDYILGQLEEKKKEVISKKEELVKILSAIPTSFANRTKTKQNLQFSIKNEILKNAFTGLFSDEIKQNAKTVDHNFIYKSEQLLEKERNKISNKKIPSTIKIIDNSNHELPDIPKSWIWTDIGSLTIFVGSGITPKGGKSQYVKEGIPFIRSQNVLFNELDLSDVAYIPEDLHLKLNRSHVKQYDVLLNITGASIGRTTIVPIGFKTGNVNQHVCIIRAGSCLNSEYLSFWLNSPMIQQLIDTINVGGTKEGLNYSHIRSFPVPFTTRDEQDLIVDKIKIKFAEITEMKKRIESILQLQQSLLVALNNVNQSVLSLAFTGKLVN